MTTNTNIPIVFILGHGRSGTTLLQTILDSNPNICAPLESRFVVHLKAKYQHLKKWTPEKKEQFIADVLAEQKIYLFWEIDIIQLKNRITNLPENSNYNELCLQVYLSRISLFEKKDITVIVDKNPIYALMIPHLLSVFPDAKFIHIIRDYRASSSSTRTILTQKPIKALAYNWLLSNTEIEKVKSKYPQNFHTLKYEDLLTNTIKEINNVTTFLNVEYNGNMLNYHDTLKQEIPNYLDRSPNKKIEERRKIGINKVHKNIAKPIDPSFINKWKTKLTTEQVQLLDNICGEIAKKHGYIIKNEYQTNLKIPFKFQFHKNKLRWYYQLPIWLRELKSKPSLGFIQEQNR